MFRFVGHRSSEPALILLDSEHRKRTVYTWADYQTEALRASNYLHSRGVKKGDFVAIIALNLPESFFTLLGTMLLGAVPVPINVPLIKERGQADLRAILDDCRPKLVLANRCLDRYLADIEHVHIEDTLNGDVLGCPKQRWEGGELLIMPYTSGTTGGPKGVMLSLGAISDRVGAITAELEVSGSERLLSYLSLGHISELVATFFGQLHSGYTVYFTEHAKELIEDREKFRLAFPHILQAARPTVFLAVPKVWINIRKEIEKKTRYVPVDLGRYGVIRNLIVRKILDRLGLDQAKRFISAGSKLSPEDELFFAKLGIYIDDVYGQTETGGPLTINGKVVGETRLMIGPDDEILVNGPNVMQGYYNNVQATARVLKDGTYHTGDVGMWQTHLYGLSYPLELDPEGRVYYGGRLGDSFKLAQGEFVPAEIIETLENEIKRIPGVDEAIVCGDGKPYLVAIVFSAGPSAGLERDLVLTIPQLGQGIHRLRGWLVVDSKELEMTPTLKVRRKAMLKKFEKEISKL